MKKTFGYILIIALIVLIIFVTQQKKVDLIKGDEVVLVSNEFSFTEGPACGKFGSVYFTDQPNNRIMKWCPDGTMMVFMDSCGRSNGLSFDNKGKLLACADEKNQMWSIDIVTKEIEVLIDNFEGMKLNGPNDMWVDKKGGIYFTDPYYKRDYWINPEKEIERENVYYLSPNRKSIKIVDDELVQPNGIIGTPDGTTLYVADIGDSKTYSYHIREDGSLSDRLIFCEMGSDGMTIDNKGNIYLTGDGVSVFDRNGEQIEHIEIDQDWTANVTFGGADRKTLFITAMNSVYTLKMNVQGVN
ncbi:MAG: SMP-30/gluconolactonase/LRE family protein [Prolixibacteraceae bacterium]|jgi:gluconolactonase|nr:SMP-30/gluconolactonase/LRE family protein [Prolixibacteraceae bacterium]